MAGVALCHRAHQVPAPTSPNQRASERERDTGFRVLGLGVGRQEKPAGGGHKGGGGGICIVRGFSLWPDWVLIVSGRMWHLLE